MMCDHLPYHDLWLHPMKSLLHGDYAIELALTLKEQTHSWRSEDLFLARQLRRASHTAASNVVEGCTKRGPREFRRFLDMSLGSLSEVEYDLRFALDAGILKPSDWDALSLLRRRAHGTTRLLYNAISELASNAPGRKS